MVSFTVRMEFPEAEHERVKEYLQKLMEGSRKEPGCVTYIPHITKTGPAAVVIYEQFRDEAALEAHRKSPHFVEYATNGLYRLTTSRDLQLLDAIG